ncbi:MAG: hypothetical protein BMS9Abin31_0772 [Gammaproteobacteria bacterium]|nr:MAG: hypothetical protein BMS9Abin31_0772 [Gammaproteobacteria bacterium]
MQVKLLHIKFVSGLFFILCSSASHAGYDAADLKKLFTDKNQRAQIDAARSGNSSGGESQQTSKINVSGYVTRSDGKSVVWINNKNTLDSTRLGDIKVYQSSIGKNKKVTVSTDGKRKQLKPGETWLKEADKIVENY